MARVPISMSGLLLVLCFWSDMTVSGELLYKNPNFSVETRVTNLMSMMTLEEKIGQMTQIELSNASTEVMKKYLIGSVLSGGGSVPKQRATAEDWVESVNEFQNGSLSTRLEIPMIYGIDAVHGHNNVYGATIFPHNVALGATRDPDLVKRIGNATALEVRATGIDYVFAPCIAVCRDPRWGRCYESYSEDHKLVNQMTDIIIGLQGEPPSTYPNNYPFVGKSQSGKVAACAKHFVGDGGTTKGINENNTIATAAELSHIYMQPYLSSIAKGVSTVMVSYSSLNGMKMHMDKSLITDYLKEKIGFKGFVISDWQGINRITSPPNSNYTYSILAGVGAGIDMVMVPFNYPDFINGLTSLVNKGAISISRINDAVSRILTVKFVMGLFENPLAEYSFAKYLGNQEHRNLAREAVRKSLVLLKNGKTPPKTLLPLSKSAHKILVAGSHADNLGYQCGGWTIEWQGFDGNNATIGTTILSAIKKAVDPKTSVVFEENPTPRSVKSGNFSYAIVVVGEKPYAETNGDNLNLTLPSHSKRVIKRVCEDVKCVVVLITGRPVLITPFVDKMDAIVAAWLPGTEGQGITDVLFGDYSFTGKLPRTWFKSVDQLPMNVGDKHYDPLYPFGFGLQTNGMKAY